MQNKLPSLSLRSPLALSHDRRRLLLRVLLGLIGTDNVFKERADGQRPDAAFGWGQRNIIALVDIVGDVADGFAAFAGSARIESRNAARLYSLELSTRAEGKSARATAGSAPVVLYPCHTPGGTKIAFRSPPPQTCSSTCPAVVEPVRPS